MSQTDDFWLRFIPTNKGEDRPTLWWAAARLVQGARRFEELQSLLGTTAAEWKAYPRVGRWEGTDELVTLLDGDAFYTTLPEAAALASESLLHVRAALDSTVYQLAWRETGKRPTGTMFPLCKKSQAWPQRVRSDLRGLPAGRVEAIKAVQPFQNVEWSRRLADLSNRDKHDHTLEVVPIYKCRVDPAQRAKDPERPGLIRYAVTEPSLSFVFLPADREIDTGQLRIATDDLISIIHGAVSFLNPLLEEEGVSPVKLQRPDGSPFSLDLV